MDQKRDLLIGVGVGPGDPELVTLKAIRVLRQAGTILVPESVQKPAPGRAEATVLAHLPAGRRCRIRRVAFPMVAEGPGPAAAAAQATAWAEAAQIVVEALEAGAGPVAFATIGDPSVYSTFSYLAQAVVARRPAATVQVIPGITAMQDLAARTAVPLCCGNQAL
ncbi:MAG: precorrin-2 C(20)-methyltransferase, partial [Micromonosporaceae bacterium]|nr:precorrin-2 C(20)-methyltransferase [Micromonosporaceae bacterium]